MRHNSLSGKPRVVFGIVVYDYMAHNNKELTIRAGEKVEVSLFWYTITTTTVSLCFHKIGKLEEWDPLSPVREMFFQRLYIVHNVGTTSYECSNDVVCELGQEWNCLPFQFFFSVRISTVLGQCYT